MRQYATSVDYAAQFPDSTAPANLEMLLRAASRVVDTILRAVPYDTDTEGYATNAEVAALITEATCWIAAEGDATKALQPGGSTDWDQVAIGSVKLGGRKTSNTAIVVDGVTVPTAAILALQSVGERVVIRS